MANRFNDMKEFIKNIKDYASILCECSIWHNSKDIIAPIVTESNLELATDCYIYEFYCYISIIVDLKNNYEIRFKAGSGPNKYKFPQAAANKVGKPMFLACKNNKIEFQICAGTKIDGIIDSEANHPDISFQLPTASDKPTQKDLIIIMDAKFKEQGGSLPKTEVYKFGMILDLFELRNEPKVQILFRNHTSFSANCLITNGKAYSNSSNVQLLQKYNMKEIENYYPDQTYNVLG